MSLSEQGTVRYAAKERAKKAGGRKTYRPDCENIHAAVISSQPRIKATTTASGLCAWLAAVGAPVCYAEGGESNLLTAMAAACEIEPAGDGWRKDGVSCGKKPLAKPINLIAHDFSRQAALRADAIVNAANGGMTGCYRLH